MRKKVVTRLSWGDVKEIATHRFGNADLKIKVWGVPRGGAILAHLLDGWFECITAVDSVEHCNMIVDDIRDSGKTEERYRKHDKGFWALIDKQLSNKQVGWVVFPWETTDPDSDAKDIVVRLLQHLGEDPTREGLLETPRRFLHYMKEMTSGMNQDPVKILNKTFSNGGDQMIVLKDIPYWSMCEHHLVPFYGSVSVGYIPIEGKVVGLSKIARLIHCYAHRLQIQEVMTQQIGKAVENALKPLGVGVIVTGRHLCMEMRGVRTGADTITSYTSGAIRDKGNNEFVTLSKE